MTVSGQFLLAVDKPRVIAGDGGQADVILGLPK